MLDRIRRHLWIWPLLFAALLTAFGYTTLRALERTMQEQVRSELETTREAAVAALEIWRHELLTTVELVSRDPRVVEAVSELIVLARENGDPREALLASPALDGLADVLDDFTSGGDVEAWGLLGPSGLMLANGDRRSIGERPQHVGNLLPALMGGESIVTPPMEWEDRSDNTSPVTMIVATPVRDAQGEVVAGLGFAVDPEGDFSRILYVARPGETGETYAFDATGVLASRSRFEPQLRELGLLDEDPNQSSTLTIHIRDPGGNMAKGFVPDLPVRARPLTRMAASAVEGETATDVEGYPDYRGVPVVGAWTWIPKLGLGLTTEMDVAEAYAGLATVRLRLLALIGLLAVGALGMFGYSFIVLRLQGQVAEIKQLGRYTIERKLGKGGMGTVYLARHALLRRPTAVKVLNTDRSDAEAVARFEREVQVSSSLSHPNTIEIYDYGYTPAGTFYYAMELLRGITIGTCIENDGPQPEARVLECMKQACASLAEAHARGLIHRDLKPSNIMLCEMGGVLDYVKVLDFGLVRQQQQSEDVALTSVNSLTGTPLYMSPEAVERPDEMDARSDVYQLGAILYYMLTGTHVFSGETPVEVLAQHIGEPPEPPSKRLGRPISPELEALVLRTLAKAPADRPADAGELLDGLEACAIQGSWTRSDARRWWASFSTEHPTALEGDSGGSTSLPSGWSVDLGRRTEED